ncbi:charged multivesicular body protein 4b-like isoform X1 [Phymastichus coffea]|uniref:charged multivesicular body protein 4b-like isoform X1 n=1 Tax=Phymastichus coffea TaxID=108790 RepID=UPI00273CABA3|nr:charged multivesicular body protein 4b-like isoform X1 [Phymastichus coffea]
MSFFAKVFNSKKKVQAAPTIAEAIQKLRDIEKMLEKKNEFLDLKIQQEKTMAKKYSTKNKRGCSVIIFIAAMQALKRKKRHEKQQQQIDNILTSIEMQREALEDSTTNTAVLHTMKSAADALKIGYKHIDIDKIHNIIENIAEQQDLARELSDAISNPVTYGQELDDNELLKELETFEQEELDRELLSIQATDKLPVVPTSKLPSLPNRKISRDDLQKLASWAS